MSFANKLVNTLGIFRSRKVFERLQIVLYHVLDMVQKCNFAPPYFSSKWTKIADSNYLKVDQNCNWKLGNQMSKFLQSKIP